MQNKPGILTVSQLTTGIKRTLEEGFNDIVVTGELSNFKAHGSGHWYFNMKDAQATICCTMWRGMNNYVFFTPSDGMNVVAYGRLTVYPPRGNYQFEVRALRPAGVGELQAAFELLKQKLSAEGLFKAEHKKEIPVFPSKIGIITAPEGAAVKDLISVAKRRYPIVELVLAPTAVQGSGAAANITRCIKELNKRHDIDLIIIARGGGSIEDLWAFNEEVVARAIFASEIPVITGIGHEIDFTIADFVADLRAATPTAAMEIATPDKNDLFAFINEFSYNSTQSILNICNQARKKVKNTLTSYGFRVPSDLVKQGYQQNDHLNYKISRCIEKIYMQKERNLMVYSGAVNSHDIRNVLKKGFVLVKQDLKFIKRSAELNLNSEMNLKFFDNEVVVSPHNGKKE
jgi:exodeoxyribonuclease VII large subunit